MPYQYFTQSFPDYLTTRFIERRCLQYSRTSGLWHGSFFLKTVISLGTGYYNRT